MELTSLSDLLELQEVDLQIDRLIDQRQSLPELESYRASHEALRDLKSERAREGGDLKRLELELDKAEGELEILESKLGEHETRLFAGGMSARETEHMRLEVQSLKGQRGTMEEKVLRMLDGIDPQQEKVAELDRQIAELDRAKSKLESIIKSEWKRIDAELSIKEERKKEAISPIDSELLELYDKLRGIKEGVAVAAFEHGVCGGCQLMLSRAEQEEAFAAHPPRCVHCRRILVA